MKTKMFGCFLLTACLSVCVFAQPTLTHCEDFTLGTVLRFKPCNTTTTFGGGGGANVTWDFTSVSVLPDTNTEWIVSPASTSYGNLFPTANLVEKYSDGTFVFAHADSINSYLVGYVDSISDFNISYPDPLLFAKRSLTYQSNYTDTFTIHYTSPSFSFNGQGFSSIEADGYGTLKLPNGTYNNTLRVKITQIQYDTIPSSGVITSNTVSYAWYDNDHTSSLFKIDSTNTSGTINKTVQYLVDETVTGVKEVNKKPSFIFFPNPVNETLHIKPDRKGTVSLMNPVGQILITLPVNEEETNIPTGNLPAGIYYLSYHTEETVQTFPFSVNR